MKKYGKRPLKEVMKKMYKIVFRCRMITPLLMKGANQRASELRSPSIKGSMRFWWRALCSQLANPPSNYNCLKKHEAFLFGDNGQYYGKSKFSIRVTSENYLKTLPSFDSYRGVRYLLAMGQSNPNFSYPNEFKIVLSSYDKNVLRNAACVFWLLASWGGLGSRARRGGGNIQIHEVIDQSNICEGLSFRSDATTQKTLKDFFLQNLELIKQQFGITVTSFNKSFQPTYPAPYAQLDRARLYILPKETSWESALNKLGEKYRQFRLSLPDNNNIKRLVQSHYFQAETLEQAAFGLPIIYKNNKSNNKPIIAYGTRYSRSASPIIFRVYATLDNHYFPLILHLNKQLLPKEQQIILLMKKRDCPLSLAQPSQDVIHRFLESFDQLVEVRL